MARKPSQPKNASRKESSRLKEKREQYERMIEVIDMKIEGRLSDGSIDRYKLEDDQTRREIERTPIKDLMALRDYYKAEISKIDAQIAGEGKSGTKLIRYVFRD